MQQSNIQGSSPTLKVKSKVLLPMALVLTILSFGSLAYASYKTYYALPEVLPTPLYSANVTTNKPLNPNLPNPSDEPNTPIPTGELIDINDYITTDPITGWTIYTNETVGYQISYPSDWLVDRELGSKGYYYDSIPITFNDVENNQENYNGVYIVPINPDYNSDHKEDLEFYNQIKSLDVGEVYSEAKVSSNNGYLGYNDVIRLETPNNLSNDALLFLYIPGKDRGNQFFAHTLLYYSKHTNNYFLLRLLSSVPPPESPYFDKRFNNISTEAKYQESLQILESFKPL